jgi:hypothetical protein
MPAFFISVWREGARKGEEGGGARVTDKHLGEKGEVRGKTRQPCWTQGEEPQGLTLLPSRSISAIRVASFEAKMGATHGMGPKMAMTGG